MEINKLYYDIDIIPSKFKRKVKIPKTILEKQEPIDATDIRKILLSCNNRRLKASHRILAASLQFSDRSSSIMRFNPSISSSIESTLPPLRFQPVIPIRVLLYT
jgi:hypothetical protein